MEKIIRLVVFTWIFVSSLKSNGQNIVNLSPSPLSQPHYANSIFKLNEEQSNNDNRMLRYSVLSGYRENVKSLQASPKFKVSVDKLHGISRFSMVNLSIIEMLTFGFVNPTRVVLEVKDSKMYKYHPNMGSEIDWKRNNTYCFEYLMPYGTANSSQIIKDELSYLFGVSCITVRRMMDVLILSKRNDVPIELQSKKTTLRESSHFDKLGIRSICDSVERYIGVPVLDETSLQNNLDVPKNINWGDILSIKNLCIKYNLDFRSGKRELEMYIIHEKDQQ